MTQPDTGGRFILSLRSKIGAGLLAALLMLVVGAVSVYSVRRASQSSVLVEHTGQVLLEQERLLSALKDVESGSRGFVVIGEDEFLGPYDAAVQQTYLSLVRLRSMTADNPRQQQRLDTLESVARQRIELSDQIIRIRRSQGFEMARLLLGTGQTTIVMDHARALLGMMEEEERALLARRTTELRSNQKFAIVFIAFGSLVAFLLSLLINRSIRRDVLERETQQKLIERQSAGLQKQAETLEAQQSELARQLEEQQALATELSSTNDNLQAANTATGEEKARAEHALSEAQEAQLAQSRLARQNSALLDSTEAGFYGMDEEGVCTFINRAGAAMLGHAPESLIGRQMHEAIHHHRADGSPFPLAECAINTASRSGQSARTDDEVFWRSDGAAMPVEYSTSPILENGELRGAVVAFADITARKKADAEREQLIAALARSNQELDQFAYVASHDLKAPLRGIANLSQWIEEDLGEGLAGESKSQMEMLRGRVHRMEALIDGILQYSRAGRAKARPEKVDTGILVAEVIDLLAASPDIVIDVMPGMPVISTERIPLQQVFLNLVGNAIKHTGRTDPKIEIRWANAGEMVEFLVCDNGQGIAPQYHERIFGIFQTLEARDKVEGTGIGLSVVMKMVESKGGRVWVESHVGQGATFHFSWPKNEVTEE